MLYPHYTGRAASGDVVLVSLLESVPHIPPLEAPLLCVSLLASLPDIPPLKIAQLCMHGLVFPGYTDTHSTNRNTHASALRVGTGVRGTHVS